MTSYPMFKYKSLLKHSNLIKEKDEYISKATGYHFNIFSILDRERNEVTTHSYFLYELMNPNGSHKQGNKFINIFLTKVLEIKEYGKVLSVKREVLTDKGRRIDFVIECDNVTVGIEMKIDAGDQQKQLYSYDEYLQKYQKHKLYYLTLKGNEASDYSKNGLATVINLSFASDILTWIDLCMKETVHISNIRETLGQYYHLLEKLTGKKESLMNEIRDLLLEGENLSIALEIANAIDGAKLSVQKKFWHSLQQSLENQGFWFEFVNYNFDASTIDEKVNKYNKLANKDRYYGLKYDLVTHEEYKISFYIELHNNIYYGLTVNTKDPSGHYKRDGKHNLESELAYYRNILEPLNLFTKSSDWWLGWKYPECGMANFYNLNDLTKKFTDEKVMNDYIELLVKEVIETIDQTKIKLGI